MMRFKELRGLALGIFLFVIDGCLLIYSLMGQERLKTVLALLFSLIILINLFTQFYIRVLNDALFLYRFAGIALLPKIVDMKDITEIELVSGHHLIIHTKDDHHHVYVWKAQKLQNCIIKKMGGS